MPNSPAIRARLEPPRLNLSGQALRAITELSNHLARILSSPYLSIAPSKATRSNDVWQTSTLLDRRSRNLSCIQGNERQPFTVLSLIPCSLTLKGLKSVSGCTNMEATPSILPYRTWTMPIWQILEGSAFAVSTSMAVKLRLIMHLLQRERSIVTKE